MANPKCAPAARVSAANALLDRGYGKPPQHISGEGGPSYVVRLPEPRLAIVEGLDVSDSRLGNVPRRYNAAPSQELLVIRHNHKTGERSLDLIKWGLTPYWCRN